MNASGSLTIYEQQDVWTVARVFLPTGAALTQSLVNPDTENPVKAYVFDITDGIAEAVAKYAYNATAEFTADTTLSAEAAPGSGGCLSDTLLSDGYWSGDATGYNFRHKMPGANFTSGGRRYRVEYAIESIAYGTLIVVTEVSTKALAFI